MDLRSCYLFQDLSDDHLKKINAMTREMSMENGQRIFTEGEEASQFHVLKEGAVELTMKMEENFEMPISLLRKPGYCFGTSALIPPHSYSLSARCVQEGSLLVIERSALQKLIEEDRDLGCIIMTNTASHFLETLKQTRQEIKVHFTTLFRSVHS